MYIIDVIPFSKSLRKESLSYFSSKDIPLGSIVTIELRKKMVRGLVVGVKDSTEQKSELKKSDFALKKIKGVSKNFLYQEAFLKSAENIGNFFGVSTGSVISTLTPSYILSDIEKVKCPEKATKNNLNELSRKFLIQGDASDRYSQYKNIIRSEFARKKSVIFLCPTIEDTLYAEEKISKGIEEHVFVLHSDLTKKQILDTWNEATTREKPCLIIITSVFIGIPRHDIGYIMIEKESSSSYRTQKQPYIDLRRFAEDYATNLNSKILFGDIMLRSETLLRFDENQFDELSPLKFRSISSAEQSIVDMKKAKNNRDETFQVLSSELKNLIKESKLKNEQIFLFGARRGLAPSIICQDCGTVVICNHCTSPMVLHGRDPSDKGNFFQCHICGSERNAGERCKKCDSWKLQTVGIGIGLIESEIKKEFPDHKIFIIDADNTKTKKQARATAEEFRKTPGAILLGTEMALLYLHEPIENGAVVTIDSLFSLPDFAIRERIMRILLRIRSRATHKFIIQTRKVEDPIFDLALRGNLSDFYREEFKKRKQFNYPPFSLIIKISIAGKRFTVEKEMEEFKKFFEPLDLITYPSFVQEQKGLYIMNGIIRLKKEDWINKELLEKIRSLPPYCKVVVDSENLL